MMTLLFKLLFFLPALSLAVKEKDAIDEVTEFDRVLREENGLVVLFSQECCTCTNCVEAEVLLGGMSQQLEQNIGVQVARVRHATLKARYGVKNVPAMAYIRDNKTAMYDGQFEFEELYFWLQDNRSPSTIDLDDRSFEHLTQAATGATTGDWLVLFHDGSCCKNREMMHLETAGVKLKNKVNVASVDVRFAEGTAERFKITGCPSVIFFRHSKMYRFSLTDITSSSLKRFAEGFYKNSKSEPVPPPPSFFDRLLDKTIQFYGKYWKTWLIVSTFTTFGLTLLLCCSFLKAGPRKKEE